MPRTFESGVSATGTAEELSINVNQVGHGLASGEVIKSSGAANDFNLAQGDSDANAEVVGVVTSVSDVNNFSYVTSAVKLASAAVPVGFAGQAVWLDPAVAGGMTVTKPTTNGQITRSLGTIIESGVSMYFDCSGLAEELTAAGTLSNYRVFQSGGGGGGGSVTSTFVAGEAIWGASDPKAVFVGTSYNLASIDGQSSTNDDVVGGINYDRYAAIGGSTHSSSWANHKFAYQIAQPDPPFEDENVYSGSTPRRTFNEIEFSRVWNNNFTVNVDIEFYNTGVTEPTGAPFYTTSITIDANTNGNDYAYNYYLGDNVDCTADLAGNNKYWVVLDFGASAITVDIGGRTSSTPPYFMEWNGAAWVAPFTMLNRVPGIRLGLVPDLGLVYNSLNEGYLEFPSASKADNLVAGRSRFIGFVNTDVAQGGVATVIKQGEVQFTTPIVTTTNQYTGFQLAANQVLAELGGIGMIANSPDLSGNDDEVRIVKVGNAVTEDILSISRDFGNEFRISGSPTVRRLTAPEPIYYQ